MIFTGNTISVQMLDGHIAELNFHTPDKPIHIFTAAAVAELTGALTALETAADVKGVIITSANSGFCAGADITEFLALKQAGPEAITASVHKNVENYNRLEDLPVPVVAAINGMALGGGLELCLACDYRIAAANAVIGLPECSLGIIPGWGGTVRLPRIAGLDTAVQWIAFAQHQQADTGLKAGVLDAVVAPEMLRDAALHTVQQCIDGKLDYRARRRQKTSAMSINVTELTLAIESSRGFVLARTGPNYPAPVTAIDVMHKAAALDRNAALGLETQALARLAGTDEAHALIGIFINERAVMNNATAWIKLSDRIIEHAAVLGAGIMGGGIAFQSALSGIPIRMKDIVQQGLDLGLSEANKLLTRRVERGRMQAAQMGQVLNNIIPTLTYDGFDRVNIVVEAVLEKHDVKLAVLAEAEQQVSADTVLVSNTSTISITSLATALQRPEKFCGMHFFNPVHAMPLVEVIRGELTADTTIARTMAYADALGKKPVIVKDCPGFLVNRTLYPYFCGFVMLLRDGADFQRVDQVMQQWGWPMGPAYLLDVVGLDPVVHSEPVMAQGYPQRMAALENNAMNILYQAGRLGQKTGKGFYDYPVDHRGRPGKTAADQTYALLKPHVAAMRDFSDEEIIDRMVIPMALETARCLEDGIVETAAAADTALILGLGFPRFRGGILRWMETQGLESVCAMADRYSALGGLYQVPENLRRLAENGGGFYNN